jgi:aldose 1-epimerase
MSSPRFIELELESTSGGKITAVVSNVGAALKTLCVNGIDIITPTTGHELNPYADGIVMAPWANRIDRGRWNLDGQELQLDINDKSLDNAIHGLVSQALFSVKEQTDSSIRLSTRIEPSGGYPFELIVSITYALTSTGITVKQSAVNHSAAAAPFVVGAHPLFQISGTPTEELEIKSAARSVDLVNERKIPIGRKSIIGTEFDITDWRKLSSCDFDHGFGDLVRDEASLAHHYLRSPNGDQIDIWQSAEFKYAFIFTPDNFYNNADPTPRSAIAIEPQTGPANAFNSKEDLIWLEPNQVFEASWGVVFTPANL